jgi:hypothetical protein
MQGCRQEHSCLFFDSDNKLQKTWVSLNVSQRVLECSSTLPRKALRVHLEKEKTTTLQKVTKAHKA